MRVTGLGRNRSETRRKFRPFRLLPVPLGQIFFFSLSLGCRIGDDLPVWLVNTGSCLCMVPFFVWRQTRLGRELHSRCRETCRRASTHAGTQWHDTCFCARPSSAGERWPTDQKKHRKSLLLHSFIGENDFALFDTQYILEEKKNQNHSLTEIKNDLLVSLFRNVWMISEPEHRAS